MIGIICVELEEMVWEFEVGNATIESEAVVAV